MTEEIFKWLTWGILESGKYLVITYGILGFEFTRNRKRWAIPLLYLVLVGWILVYCLGDELNFKTLFGLVLILSLFNGSVLKRIQCFVLEYFLITALDLASSAMWGAVSGAANTLYSNRVTETFSLIMIIVFCLILRDKRKAVCQGICQIRAGYFILILVLLVVTVTLVSFAYGIVTEGSILLEESIHSIRRMFFLMTALISVGIFLLSFWLFYYIYMRGQLEERNRLSLLCLEYQKKFYTALVQKDEGMHRFRHDMSKHLGVIEAMCRQNEYDKVQKYIEELQDHFADLRMRYTGNVIVDYFLNEAVAELQQKGRVCSCDVIGAFPDRMKLSDGELSVVFGNAIENAKEELLQCGGDLKLEIVIEHYKDKLYVRISNTCRADREQIMKTNKQDPELHGYGVGNMEQIVRKYKGDIQWSFRDQMFELNIEL
ncbi:MAG: GHKL domain-containing protein [Eubacterium sp.]|nr:GHKL domain-containing protein [Eubacterium sp.]